MSSDASVPVAVEEALPTAVREIERHASESVLTRPDLVPGLVDLVRATVEEARHE